MTEQVDPPLRDQRIRLRDWVAENTEKMKLLKKNIEARKADSGIERPFLAGVVGRAEFALLEARVAELERSGRAKIPKFSCE